jgi:hypothetical protein
MVRESTRSANTSINVVSKPVVVGTLRRGVEELNALA